MEVGNQGAEWATMGTFCWEPMRGGRRGRDWKPNSVGGRGEAETESLILWLVVLELLVGGWLWREAQSLIQGLLETYILYTWFWECLPWGWFRLSDWVKETLCCKMEMEIYFYLFFCLFIFYLLFVILFVKFLQNRQVMVTSLGLCCWPGRRVPQSSDCWSSGNIWG